MKKSNNRTLHQVLTDLGYTHQLSKGFQYSHDIYNGETFIGTFSASQCWEWLINKGLYKEVAQ